MPPVDDDTDSSVRIERLGRADWELLRDLRLAALRDAPHAFWAQVSDESRYDRQRWLSFLDTVTWFVARRGNDDVLGIAGLHRSGDDDPEVIGMWVVAADRSKGIGARLTRAAVQQAWTQGAESVGLWVTDGNVPATRMYQRLGFVFTGERATLPHNAAAGERRMIMNCGRDRA